MKRKLQLEMKEILNKSNISKENKTNVILITHCKNKSVDLKHPLKTDFILKETKNDNSENKKKYKKLNKKIKIINKDVRNIKLLNNNKSVSNIFLKNKNKKYFFDDNFFCGKNSKNKLNNSFKRNSLGKKTNNNAEPNNVIIDIRDNSGNIKRNKNIKLINKINIIKDQSHINKKNQKDINNIKIHDILYDNNKDENNTKPKNKSKLIYIKSKINRIPYRNNICSTARVNLSQKDDIIKLNKLKFNNLMVEDSLESHNTILDENNINQYKYFQQNLSCQDTNKCNNDTDKSFKRIVPRKKNLVGDSLKNKYKKKLPLNLKVENNTIKNLTPKTSRSNDEKYHLNYGINLNNNFIYKKVNSQRPSSTLNKNINSLLESSLSTTRNQTNKYKEILNNIVVNNEVTEFVYSDDIIDNNPNNKKVNIKNWLSNSGLYSYYQNFYNKNIYDLNSLINNIKKIKKKNKNCLFEYIENNFHIHLPGHIFRILLKIEIEEGEFEKKITNFFIKQEENTLLLNTIKPSLLLQLYDNCDNFIDYTSLNKNNLRVFLKKYHLFHLYHNFYQNGFELINFVILQMYSKNYMINDNILENCFHIYNQNDRILVLNSLKNEKMKIDIFLNSNGYEENNNISGNQNLGKINLNNFNYYNNFDVYFSSKESQETSCKICSIF